MRDEALLARLEASAFLREVSVDQLADAGFKRIHQLRDEGVVRLDLLGTGKIGRANV